MVKFFFSIFLFSSIIVSQTDTTGKFLFESGLKKYQSGDYAGALNLFDQLVLSINSTQFTTAAWVFSGKSSLELKYYRQASERLRNFLLKFPESKYVFEALNTLGNALYFERFYDTSATTFLTLFNSTKDKALKLKAKNNFISLSENLLSINDLTSFLKNYRKTPAEALIYNEWGKKEINAGQLDSARARFSYVIVNFYGSDESKDAEQLRSYAFEGSLPVPDSPDKYLVAMLPLMEYNKSELPQPVKAILEGIKFAVHTHNMNVSTKVGLLIYDTERSESRINSIMDDLKKTGGIAGIVGPLYSDESIILANLSWKLKIPTITPTATDNSLKGISKFFYRANPDFELRGKGMAQFVYNVENKRNIAVLYSSEGYGSILAESFMLEFKKLGGNITLYEEYSAAKTNLEEHFQKLTPYMASLDGVYLPVSDSRVTSILISELSKMDFSKSIYGNQDWLLGSAVDKPVDMLNQLILSSDYFIDFYTDNYKIVSRDFYEYTGMIFDRNAAYGFDAANLILSQVTSSSIRSTDVQNLLSSGLKFTGIRTDYSFDYGGANKYLNFLKYVDGVFEQILRLKVE